MPFSWLLPESAGAAAEISRIDNANRDLHAIMFDSMQS